MSGDGWNLMTVVTLCLIDPLKHPAGCWIGCQRSRWAESSWLALGWQSPVAVWWSMMQLLSLSLTLIVKMRTKVQFSESLKSHCETKSSTLTSLSWWWSLVKKFQTEQSVLESVLVEH